MNSTHQFAIRSKNCCTEMRTKHHKPNDDDLRRTAFEHPSTQERQRCRKRDVKRLKKCATDTCRLKAPRKGNNRKRYGYVDEAHVSIFCVQNDLNSTNYNNKYSIHSHGRNISADFGKMRWVMSTLARACAIRPTHRTYRMSMKQQ